MKKIAESKAQILAALALAFVLGVAMVPHAAFALEGEAGEGNEGIELLAEGEGTNAEGDGAGEADGETEEEAEEDVAENIVELYSRIQKNDSFAGYRKSEKLVQMVLGLMSTDATEANEATRAAMLATLRTEVKTLLPTLTGVDTMSEKELVEAAQTLPEYENYAKLWLAMGFITEVVEQEDGTAVELTKALLDEKYTEKQLMMDYNELAVAAVAIDEKAADGLMKYDLPQASAPEVETPNTGVNTGIFEGSLDLAMVTLIASAVVAILAGTGVLARLYLHRKF